MLIYIFPIGIPYWPIGFLQPYWAINYIALGLLYVTTRAVPCYHIFTTTHAPRQRAGNAGLVKAD